MHSGAALGGNWSSGGRRFGPRNGASFGQLAIDVPASSIRTLLVLCWALLTIVSMIRAEAGRLPNLSRGRRRRSLDRMDRSATIALNTQARDKELLLTSGGNVALRGYRFQVMVAVLQGFQRFDWTSVSIEPKSFGADGTQDAGSFEAVDIYWRHGTDLKRYVQVKSSINSIGNADIEAWAKKVGETPGPAELELVALGCFKSNVKTDETRHGVLVRCRPNDEELLSYACSWLLANALKRMRLSPRLEAIPDILQYLTAQLFEASVDGREWSQSNLWVLLRKAVAVHSGVDSSLPEFFEGSLEARWFADQLLLGQTSSSHFAKRRHGPMWGPIQIELLRAPPLERLLDLGKPFFDTFLLDVWFFRRLLAVYLGRLGQSDVVAELSRRSYLHARHRPGALQELQRLLEQPDEPRIVELQALPQSFLVGSSQSDSLGHSSERPQHAVGFSSFHVLSTPVTVGMYRKFDGQHPSLPSPAMDAHPVTGVTWFEACAFAEWVGGRLPTQFEWEFCARGGQSTRFWWGDDPGAATEMVWHFRAPTAGTRPVGLPASIDSARRHPFGLRDVLGHVEEWCLDAWTDNFDPLEGTASLVSPCIWSTREPVGEAVVAVRPSGDLSEWWMRDSTNLDAKRVVRGGSFKSTHPREVRAAQRHGADPWEYTPYRGFRVVWQP